ncbi:hypothetical protein WBJ53_26205 [Spirosoma sp. SC4-14]|uniref:hypothetical protein n=1 Tax=Spirosoma sp. SC4-14 TaxID=3128900 RepID=UPI0030D40A83
MKISTEKIIALVTGVLAMLFFVAVMVQAQPVPIEDCCSQAISYKQQLEQMTKRYSESSRVLAETRKAGDDLVAEKDRRIKSLQDEANAKLTSANSRDKNYLDALKMVRSELENEMLRTRFLGIGRRKWAKQLRERLQ